MSKKAESMRCLFRSLLCRKSYNCSRQDGNHSDLNRSRITTRILR
nr:MAG TPA: hypothetical protein [Caudoviricetes sp.]